jgi:hypothetical protein
LATKLYLRSTTANVGTHAATKLSTALTAANGTPPTAAARDLSTTVSVSAQSTLVATLTSSTVVNQKIYYGKWISPVLAVDITAQTWTVAFSGLESSANANQIFGASIYVLTSGDTVRGFVYDNGGGGISGTISTELATAQQGRVATVTGSAVSGVLTTDTLAVEIWTLGQESTTAGAYTITAAYDGTTDPVNTTASTAAAAYISTPQDIFTAPATKAIPAQTRLRRSLLNR